MSTVEDRIKALFPDAAPYDQVLDEYYQRMIHEFGLEIENTIAAVSLCPDELNNVVIEKVRSYFNNVFLIGGLAGYPFTGITGFNAFGDHIPDDGTAFVFFGPHLAIDEKSLGFVHRHGQKRDTLSCGAAFGAYRSLLKHEGTPDQIDPNDYQQGRIQQMLAPMLDQIPKKQPEPKVMDILFDESHDFIVTQSKRIKELFKANKVILMGAFVINTPLDMSDYLWVKYFEEL
ncbi:hypothetical protein [uncultured Sunxiuqinia sp.]|uniref:hypothetical protein n=1 Tax=uncultured Sunxiuqinia sp. TaxID=1573825 RepID=UPI002AA79F3D|nr:hypothetical protein [uncultured Sunxiuqinia sp.]